MPGSTSWGLERGGRGTTLATIMLVAYRAMFVTVIASMERRVPIKYVL